MFKEFTKETVLEMLEKNVLEIGQYVLTDHYLLVGENIMQKAYDYLLKNGYASMMESNAYCGRREFGIIQINR